MYRQARIRNKFDAWAIYKRANDECEQAIATAKQNYYQTLVDDLTDYNVAPKKWWSTIKNLSGRGKTEAINYLLDDADRRIYDGRGKCDLLNNYFARQSCLDDSNVPVPPVTPYTDASIDSMSFTADEVMTVINGLNITKATGPDGIGNSFIKKVFLPFSNEITIFFNYCILHAIEDLKCNSSF
jgi:hypothetical protein